MTKRKRSEIRVVQGVFEKKCNGKCEQFLEVSDFAKHKKASLGVASKCKKCKNSEKRRKIISRKNDSNFKITKSHKKCNICKTVRRSSEFYANFSAADGLRSNCKKCGPKARAQEYMDSERIAVKNCPICQYADWRAFDFAHKDRRLKKKDRRGKKVDFNRLTLEEMLIERPLVDIICKNCHRIETKDEDDELKAGKTVKQKSLDKRKQRQRRYDFVNLEKVRRGACLMCGFKVTTTNFRAFDFDHRDPNQKEDCISSMCGALRSYEDLTIEMAKCDLPCANCHCIKTIENGDACRKSRAKRKSYEAIIEEPQPKKRRTDTEELVHNIIHVIIAKIIKNHQ